MRIIHILLTTALVAALVTFGTPSDARAIEGVEPEVVPYEYLVGPEADLGRLPRDAAVRDLGGGWTLVTDDRAGSPRTVAGELEAEARGRVVPNVILHPAAPADEPRFDEQWALENTGQTGGVPGADINIAAAWDVTTGNPSTVVAVLDSGIDLDHQDLASSLWVNPGEVAGNGVDDDGNGFIDDINGWDFVGDDADVADTTGHGTQVAGLVGAAVNDLGIVGVAPDVRIMPIRVCAAGCPLGDIVAGLAYAAAEGAAIVNMAFTGAGPFFEPIGDLLADEASGVLAVAASGNDAIDTDIDPRYPASFDLPNVIAVASTDDDDGMSSFSNYGATSVDLGAPGNEVLTTNFDGDYLLANGTSFSTPHVSGVAALIATIRPDLGAEGLAGMVLDTVGPVPDLAGLTVTGGRLNAGAAIAAAGAPVAAIQVTPASPTVPADVEFSAAASFAPLGEIVSYGWVFSDGFTSPAQTVTRTFTFAESITATLTVTDDSGRAGTVSTTIALRDPAGAIVSATPEIAAAPATVTVAATLPSGTAVSASWDLGDGQSASGTTVTHVFEDRGVYTVSVDVVSASGGIGSGQTDVYVGSDFTDSRNSLFWEDILWLSATGITRGCNPPIDTKFCPSAHVTRAQVAAMIVRALGLPRGPDAFVDDDGSIFESDINALAAAGISTGCNPPGNDRFCPNRLLSRAELASLFTKAFSLTGGDDRFVDDDGSPHEASIDALAASGLTIGCNPPLNDMFCPNNRVTRGQLAAFFHRAGIHF